LLSPVCSEVRKLCRAITTSLSIGSDGQLTWYLWYFPVLYLEDNIGQPPDPPFLHCSDLEEEQDQPSNIPYLAGIWFYQTSSPLLRYGVSRQLFWSTTLRKFRYSGDKNKLEAVSSSTPYTSPDLNMIYQTYQGQPSSEVHRSRHYLAPTWSWAAIGSHIVYEDGAEILAARFEIVFCDVKLEMQEAPYGAVKGGRLKVRGRLSGMLWQGILFRPDTEDDDRIFSKILRGDISGPFPNSAPVSLAKSQNTLTISGTLASFWLLSQRGRIIVVLDSVRWKNRPS
jgi:hypothetical protein